MPKRPFSALSLYRIYACLYQHRMQFLAGIIYRLNLLIFNCVIPPTCVIGKGTWFTHSVGIVLHPYCQIGENCIICQNVTLGGGKVKIGNECLIGANAVCLGDICIGNNCRIGANTFVNFDVPDGSTVVGEKGHIVQRSDDLEK